MQTLPRTILVALVLLLPAPLFGEGYTLHSTLDTKAQGGLGTLVGFASSISGHSLRNVATTTLLDGHKLRTENDASGTIYDLDAERVITFDHKRKTYSSTTFAEMRAAMEKARASAEQSRAKDEAKAAKANPEAAKKEDKLNLKYQVKVDRPGPAYGGNRLGYGSEHVYITITLEAEAVPAGGRAEQAGSVVMLLDQWITKDAPLAPAFAEFYRLFAQKLGREFHSQTQGLQALFAADPRMKEGFEAAAKEMQKVQGIPLRSTTHMVLVPANQSFDRQLAIALGAEAQPTAVKPAESEKSEKPKSGFGRFMGALKNAAEQANKQLDKGNSNDAPPKQTTLLVIDDAMTSVSKGPIPAAMFAPPAGYSEVKARSL